MPLKNNSKWAAPIAERYQKGESVRDISLSTGLTENTVKSYLSVMKVPRDEKRLEIGTPEADAWAEKWNAARERLINAGFRQ